MLNEALGGWHGVDVTASLTAYRAASAGLLTSALSSISVVGFPLAIRDRWRHEWQKLRQRNEALDCRVYARAAASGIGLDRYQDNDWRAIEGRMGGRRLRRNHLRPRQRGRVRNHGHNPLCH